MRQTMARPCHRHVVVARRGTRVEQRVARFALHDERELPSEVVRVVDRGVQAEARRRRVSMRGVTGEKHAAELRRPTFASTPVPHDDGSPSGLANQYVIT